MNIDFKEDKEREKVVRSFWNRREIDRKDAILKEKENLEGVDNREREKEEENRREKMVKRGYEREKRGRWIIERERRN